MAVWSPFSEHRTYLADQQRIEAFAAALGAVVRPGATVLDLGAGTGVLGILALRAGASRVLAVDGSAMLAVARSIARANHLDDRITTIRAISTEVELPGPVDVVVADQLGPMGIEAGVFEYFADARRRLLAPDGVTVPRHVSIEAAPVAFGELEESVAFWSRNPLGVDTDVVVALAANSRHVGTAPADSLLAPPTRLAGADPGDGADLLEGSATFTVARPGRLSGLAAWFVAELAPGIEMTNSPVAAGRIDRDHALLPIGRPVEVAPGHTIEVSLLARPASGTIRWRVTVLDGDGTTVTEARHSTVEGEPLVREDLDRARPDAVPSLSRYGAARRTVLQACDGERSIAEIGQLLDAEHHQIFDSPTSAAAFVIDVLRQSAT